MRTGLCPRCERIKSLHGDFCVLKSFPPKWEVSLADSLGEPRRFDETYLVREDTDSPVPFAHTGRAANRLTRADINSVHRVFREELDLVADRASELWNRMFVRMGELVVTAYVTLK